MVIWAIYGNEIGPNGNGAYYFTTKREADYYLRAYQSDEGGVGNLGDGPEKIVIKNREQLCRELNNAMGYGAS